MYLHLKYFNHISSSDCHPWCMVTAVPRLPNSGHLSQLQPPTIRRRTLGSRTSRAAESGPKLGNGKIIVCLYEHPCPPQWRFSSPINMFGLQGSLPSMQILLALIIDFSSSLFLSTCCFQRTHICWALHMSEVKWFRDASAPYISGSEGCLSIDPH